MLYEMIIEGFEYQKNGYKILMSYNFTMNRGSALISLDNERIFEIDLDHGYNREAVYDLVISKKRQIIKEDKLPFEIGKKVFEKHDGRTVLVKPEHKQYIDDFVDNIQDYL